MVYFLIARRCLLVYRSTPMEVADNPKEFLRACGERLRERRRAILDENGKPLTLAAAAARIGRPDGKALWRRWEKGSPPGAHTAVLIAESIGATVEEIWGRAPLPEVDASDEADDGDDEEAAS